MVNKKGSPRFSPRGEAGAGEAGQVVLALILIMTVALAIGVSVIQKSLVDVSTATKVEQSQRAFSAAEAGIEKALRGDITGVSLTDTGNQSYASVTGGTSLPVTAGALTQQDALEYASLAKEDFAHIWLADPTSLSNPPSEFYMPAAKTTERGIDVYWGKSSAEKAAISIKIIYYDGSAYQARAYYFDSDSIRSATSGFSDASSNCTNYSINTTEGASRPFYCKVTITPTSSPAFPASNLMLVRIRLLYNSTSQPTAVRGLGTCGADCSLPPQVKIIVSTGVSGNTARQLKLFQIDRVVPPYFDFALFSSGEIRKQ